MKRYLTTIVTLAVAVLSAGCIKENLDDCYNLSLTFSYKGDSNEEIFSKSIEKVDLYVFNDKKELVDNITYKQDDLIDTRKATPFRLNPGKYYIVAIANQFERTDVHISPDGDFSKSYFQHPELGRAGGCVDGHDHNYHAYKEITMASYQTLEETIEFNSSHINVLIEVSGMQPGSGINTKAENGYQIFFEESNGKTDFYNRVIPGELGICEPVMIYDKEKGKYVSDDLTLFRMDDYCGHILKVLAPDGKELVSIEIADFLKEHKEIDITKQEALLPIEIQFNAMNVTVTVPDWYIVDTKPEF